MAMNLERVLTSAGCKTEKHREPLARDEMTKAAFDEMMRESMEQAKAGQGIPVEEAFAVLRECL